LFVCIFQFRERERERMSILSSKRKKFKILRKGFIGIKEATITTTTTFFRHVISFILQIFGKSNKLLALFFRYTSSSGKYFMKVFYVKSLIPF